MSASSPLTTGLLAAVSRSFYLSLRVLPKNIREPLSLGYLLARAADTIADVPVRPAAERLELLKAFDQAISSGPEESFLSAVVAFSKDVTHEGERILLTRLRECFDTLGAGQREDADLTRTVLHHIVSGQSLDLLRFSGAPTIRDSPLSAIPSLPDAAALDEYTWLVAGCVGEFWTMTCLLHLPQCASVARDELIRHAVLYGKGLQLINILRDQPKDMAEGRCYLPADELHAAGVTNIAWPATDWKPWHAVRRPWLIHARQRMQSGRAYVRGLNSVRLRFAALLPLLIGEATLDLLDAQPVSEPPGPAKITRPRVKCLMRRALWFALRRKC